MRRHLLRIHTRSHPGRQVLGCDGRVGSSRTVNGFKGSSSSVDGLGREMLEMRLWDKVDQDDDRDSEPDIIGGDGCCATALDPSNTAFDDLMAEDVGRVSASAEKIGGQVLDVTKILAEAFSAQRELLVKVKQTQKPDMAGLAEFLKPLNNMIMKANAMTEGRSGKREKSEVCIECVSVCMS
ncbi:unnamed protein product [Camellia sinensis]